MPAKFVNVPADEIRSKLAHAGFSPIENAYREEVWERTHHRDRRYVVRVYTSIARGSSGARDCGRDAIRAVGLLVTPSTTYPIHKATRVHRTGTIDGVLERMLGRARECYAACGAHRRKMQKRGAGVRT